MLLWFNMKAVLHPVNPIFVARGAVIATLLGVKKNVVLLDAVNPILVAFVPTKDIVFGVILNDVLQPVKDIVVALELE